MFLSVFDVHVQRVPVAGLVTRAVYKPGKFLSADLDKASEDNERNSLLLTTEDGVDDRGRADRRPDRAAHRVRGRGG